MNELEQRAVKHRGLPYLDKNPEKSVVSGCLCNTKHPDMFKCFCAFPQKEVNKQTNKQADGLLLLVRYQGVSLICLILLVSAPMNGLMYKSTD